MVERTPRGTGNDSAPGFEMFRYQPVAAPAGPSWEAFESIADAQLHSIEPAPAEDNAAARQARTADEIRRSFERGRERGFAEGQAAEREAVAATLQAKDEGMVEQVARLAEAFHAERARYFEAVEHEVVKLALGVAARILRREAQVDPLLLSGAVRVALGQLSSSTQVRLYVPAADLELWAEAIAHMPNLSPKPSVVGGEDMSVGECVLEAELGSVDLGLAAQLAEIEGGFFDRAGRNPAKIREDMFE